MESGTAEDLHLDEQYSHYLQLKKTMHGNLA